MWFYMWKSVFICGNLYFFPVVFITVINDALSPCSLLSYLFIVLLVFFMFVVLFCVLFLARKQCIPKYFKTVKKALWLYHLKRIPCVLVASLK